MKDHQYLITEPLQNAVDMARLLGMPLLLTGDPGVGKSSLARAVAENDNQPCFEVRVHSDTRYRDLFYHFDDMGRFSEANLRQEISAPDPHGLAPADARNFIRFQGLGAAILQALDRNEAWLQPALRTTDLRDKPTPSVVLIDEIDKAPRDVPNDLLVQLEQWTFDVPEFSRVPGYPSKGFALGHTDPQPLVVITSNGEKPLPDAFLRRCVYFHISLPVSRDKAPHAEVTLNDIVAAYVKEKVSNNRQTAKLQDEAVRAFGEVRTLASGRKPGLAELLNWVHYLSSHESEPDSVAKLSPEDIRHSICALLLKSRADHEKLNDALDRKNYPLLAVWLGNQS